MNECTNFQQTSKVWKGTVISRPNTEFVATTVLPGFLSFHLIYISHSCNTFNLKVIGGRYRSAGVIRRSNTEFVATTVLPGFLAFA